VQTTIEKVAINDVGLLPLKAARRDAIANLKSFWGPRQQRLNFGFIYIHYAVPPRSTGIVITASVDVGRLKIPVLLLLSASRSFAETKPSQNKQFIAQFLSEGTPQHF